MGVPRRSFLAALGLAALLCPAAHVDAQDGGGGGGGGDGGGEECSASSDAAFMYEESLTTGLTLRWTPDTDTVSFQVVYEGQAWVGIGFSADGQMVGADSVIGLPDDNTVLEYDLEGQAVYAITEYAEQEISDASISQDASATTMTFTRPIKPTVASKESLEDATIIWAWGESNVFENHGQDNRGRATITILCEDSTVASTTPPTVAATSAPIVTPSPTTVTAETIAPIATPSPTTVTAETITPIATPSPTTVTSETMAPVADITPTASPVPSGTLPVPPSDATPSPENATQLPTLAPSTDSLTRTPAGTAAPVGRGKTDTPSPTLAPTVAPTSAVSKSPMLAKLTDSPTSVSETSAPGTTAPVSMMPTPVPTSAGDRGLPVSGENTSAPTAAPTLGFIAGTTRSPVITSAPLPTTEEASGADARSAVAAGGWVAAAVVSVAAMVLGSGIARVW